MTEITAPQSVQPHCARLVNRPEQALDAVHRSSKKPRGLDHLKEIQPPAEANAYAAQLRKVRYGPATLDAFLMPDGSFRFSMRSAAASVHMLSNSQAQRTIERVVQGNMPEPGPAQIPVIAGDPAARTPCPGPLLMDVPFAGPAGYATTMDHQTLIRFWAEPDPRFGLLLPAPQIVAASHRSIPLAVLRCLHIVGCGDAVGQAGYLVSGNGD